MKVKTSKGFTLAELLIVMAIIVVLAAVAIPTFSRQLETARESGDLELIRNAYTEALSLAILDAADGNLDGNKGSVALVASTDTVNYAKFRWDNTNKTWTVKLEDATTQTEKAFKYVNAVVGGCGVGITDSNTTTQTLTAEYNNAAVFTFALTNGDLSLSRVVTGAFPTT